MRPRRLPAAEHWGRSQTRGQSRAARVFLLPGEPSGGTGANAEECASPWKRAGESALWVISSKKKKKKVVKFSTEKGIQKALKCSWRKPYVMHSDWRQLIHNGNHQAGSQHCVLKSIHSFPCHFLPLRRASSDLSIQNTVEQPQVKSGL